MITSEQENCRDHSVVLIIFSSFSFKILSIQFSFLSTVGKFRNGVVDQLQPIGCYYMDNGLT